MVKSLLVRLPRTLPRLRALHPCVRTYATGDRTSDRVPTNDPSPPAATQNVSDSNAVPVSPQGIRDSEHPLQERPEDSERQRVMQAPNRPTPWSRSQQPRERAMSGPRFEQTIMELQVMPLPNPHHRMGTHCKRDDVGREIEGMGTKVGGAQRDDGADSSIYPATTASSDKSNPSTTRPLDERKKSSL